MDNFLQQNNKNADTMESILQLDSKSSISNYLSHFTYDDVCVGLGKTYFIGKSTSSASTELARFVFKNNGQEITPVLYSNKWLPWGICSEYHAGKLKITQMIIAGEDTIFCDMSFAGTAGFSAEVVGESYHAAKAFGTGNGIIIEETSTQMKPLITRILLDSGFQNCLISNKTDSAMVPFDGFSYSNMGLRYQFILSELPRQLQIRVVFAKTLTTFKGLDPGQTANQMDAKEIRRSWENYFAQNVPAFRCSDRNIEKVYYYNWYVQRVNTVLFGGDLPYAFTSPSKISITGYWLLDCSVHAMTQNWLNDDDVFYGNLLNAANIQSDGGCMADASREYGAVAGDGQWYSNHVYDSKERTGDPRYLAAAVWEIYMKTGDMQFLKRMYPHLLSEYKWLRQDKASKLDENLITARTWCDISWDNSKRFGKNAYGGYGGTGEQQRKEAEWGFPIATIDGNMHYYLLLKVISDIAGMIGEEVTSKAFLEKAMKTREAINAFFWDEDEGFYFDRIEDGRMARVFTPAAFLLLLAGIPSKTQYVKLKEKLLDPMKFWVKYPLPSVSVEDDSFDPENYWRGPAWLIVNYEVMEGLFDYDPETAFLLFFKTIDLLTHSGDPTSREHYNCLTGKGAGALDYAWDGIINKLIISRILGVRPYPEKVLLKPCLPNQLENISMMGLKVAGTSMDLEYENEQGIWSVIVKNSGEKALMLEYENQEYVIESSKNLQLEYHQ